MDRRIVASLRLVVLLGVLAFPSYAIAARKAFVVGVSAYASLPQLLTPRRDADAVKRFLSDLGFTVTELVDPEQSTFTAAWKRFTGSIGDSDIVAFFYFAGHGVRVDSVNHLLLKDTPGVETGARAVLNSALNFHELMEAVEERQPSSLYILDSCRDNPFGSTAKSTRLGVLHGLARGTRSKR
jgi:uncharacterized caspase-like protein